MYEGTGVGVCHSFFVCVFLAGRGPPPPPLPATGDACVLCPIQLRPVSCYSSNRISLDCMRSFLLSSTSRVSLLKFQTAASEHRGLSALRSFQFLRS